MLLGAAEALAGPLRSSFGGATPPPVALPAGRRGGYLLCAACDIYVKPPSSSIRRLRSVVCRAVTHHLSLASRGAAHLIFQPAEEAGGGAAVMIADGLFADEHAGGGIACDAAEVYGLHNWPAAISRHLGAGQFSARAGPIMASADEVHRCDARPAWFSLPRERGAPARQRRRRRCGAQG